MCFELASRVGWLFQFLKHFKYAYFRPNDDNLGTLLSVYTGSRQEHSV